LAGFPSARCNRKVLWIKRLSPNGVESGMGAVRIRKSLIIKSKTKQMTEYKDNTVLTWGKYKGQMLENVPADYLLWLYENKKGDPDLWMYIKANMDALLKEQQSKTIKFKKKN
jgi:uncharacterized protein (DUF3820 family)